MGGRRLAPLLRELARNAPSQTAIVELGTWLGAGTAQLAIGVRERERTDVSIHCYDQWRATRQEVALARSAGVRLRRREDTLPRTRRTLAPFGVPIQFHQGDVMKVERWSGDPISIFVDDTCKDPPLFITALSAFAHAWIPGTTVAVLMDYGFWEDSGNPVNRCQQDIVETNPDCFEPLELSGKVLGKTSVAAFRIKRNDMRIPLWVAKSAIEHFTSSKSWRFTSPLRRLRALMAS